MIIPKQILLILPFLLWLQTAGAQNIQVSFSASGASGNIDSVRVENLTQCTSMTLTGEVTGDILNLVDHVGQRETSIPASSGIKVLPNPAPGHFTLSFSVTESGPAMISLQNLMGGRLAEIQHETERGTHELCVAVGATGTYLVNVTLSGKNYATKLLSTGCGAKEAYIQHTAFTPELTPPAATRGTSNIIQMQYNYGDRILLRGYSSNYGTVVTFTPAGDTTIDFNFVPCTDGDGIHYSVVRIGTQLWMAENLRTSVYNDGSPIPEITADTVWKNMTSAAWCWFQNDSAANEMLYGKFYNWFVCDTMNNGNRSVCPTGWHMPDDTVWTKLQNHLGGWQVAGGKMKEKCELLFNSPNVYATNETGFTGLPAGRRLEGLFFDRKRCAFFWSATEWAYSWRLTDENGYLSRNCIDKPEGMAIRCIKD